MTSRPERRSQQPISTTHRSRHTSADQSLSHTSARRHSPTRSGRQATLARQATFARDAIFLIPVIALLMVWAARTLAMGTPATPATAFAAHTVTPQCVSAEDMARAYGWTGDWREYSYQIGQLNPSLDWGSLHAGETIRVPDYRTHQNSSPHHQQLDRRESLRSGERRAGSVDTSQPHPSLTGWPARPIPHGGNHDSTVAATPKPGADS